MGPFEIRWEFSAFVLGTFFLYLLSNLSWTFNDRKLFRLLPVVGVWRLVPARGCTLLRSIFGTSNWALNGYTKHISRNVPYIMPSIDRGPVVVLPPSQIRRFYNLPEEELDAHRTSNESIQTSYTIQDQHIVHHPLHFDIIRHKISRNLDVLTQPIATELDIGFRRIWGLGTEWRDIPVWQSCMDIIAGAANAALSGHPLCRDGEYLRYLQDHAMTIIGGAIVINATPWPFTHLVGLLIRLACSYHCKKVLKKCMPVIQDRLDHTLKRKADLQYHWTPPNDGLQWIIEEALTKNNPTELDARRIGERLIFLNDVSMHTTSYTMQNFILNLYSSDPGPGYIEVLREECRKVFDEAGSCWSRDAVQDLKLVDAAIRESMRISPFSVFGLPRRVVNPRGLLVGSGDSIVCLPQGTVVALPIEHTHHDKDLYPKPHVFNPFRFATPANNAEKVKSAVTLDDRFLGFGTGKFACPGRFFAVHEMKLTIAHMLLNYDVDYIKQKPSPMDIIWLKAPRSDVTIQVRRRNDSRRGR